MQGKERYVTEGDWAFASLKEEIVSHYEGSDMQTVITGTPKLYPRTIHITQQRKDTKEPVASYILKVGQPISEQSEAVRDAYDTLRSARRYSGPRS